jgi:hypothetical protein
MRHNVRSSAIGIGRSELARALTMRSSIEDGGGISCVDAVVRSSNVTMANS